jgi:hypothetical protein
MTFKADVYKLCCLDTEIKDVYVGSTRSFRQRKSMHKYICNTPTDKSYNLYVYDFIRTHGGFQNWSMISIFTSDFETTHEMHRKEREFIEILGATLNKVIPKSFNTVLYDAVTGAILTEADYDRVDLVFEYTHYVSPLTA